MKTTMKKIMVVTFAVLAVHSSLHGMGQRLAARNKEKKIYKPIYWTACLAIPIAAGIALLNNTNDNAPAPSQSLTIANTPNTYVPVLLPVALIAYAFVCVGLYRIIFDKLWNLDLYTKVTKNKRIDNIQYRPRRPSKKTVNTTKGFRKN